MLSEVKFHETNAAKMPYRDTTKEVGDGIQRRSPLDRHHGGVNMGINSHDRRKKRMLVAIRKLLTPTLWELAGSRDMSYRRGKGASP